MSTRGIAGQHKVLAQTNAPLTIKGGVIRNIDGATGGIKKTTAGFIEDEKYGIVFSPAAGATNYAEFLSGYTGGTGNKVIHLNLSVPSAGNPFLVFGYNSGTAATLSAPLLSKYAIRLKPSTVYRIKMDVKIVGRSGSSSMTVFTLHQYKSDGVRITNSSRTTTSQNDADFVEYTYTITTDANVAWGVLGLTTIPIGETADVYIDWNSATLEEVTTINNPSSVPALLYPKVTAVMSTDNIDQSQVVADTQGRLGEVASVRDAQQFLPTKKYLTGIVFRRGTDTGTYTGDVKISIQADSSTAPSGTDLASVTLTNAEWGAITANTDYTVSLPLTLTVNGSTTYWIVFTSSTADDSNYTRVYAQATAGYPGGVHKTYNGSVWSAAKSTDDYFKTLYSKNTTNFTVRTNTETLSVTAPTVEGWANGTVIDTADESLGYTPLTLTPGSNNIYYSSNGHTSADSETDESLQATIQPLLYRTKDRATAVSRKASSNRVKVRDSGTALKFDGTGLSTNGQYVTLNNIDTATFAGSNPFSISLKCKINGTAPAGSAALQHIFGRYAGGAPELDITYGNTTGDIRAITRDSSITATSTTGRKIGFGKWYDVVFVVNPTVSRQYLYLNGVLVDNDAMATGTIFSATTMSIGKAQTTGDTTARPLNGVVDDVRLYNRALSASEISAMYYNNDVPRDGLIGEWLFDEATGTTALDTSGNGNHGTITGATYTLDVPFKPRTNI